MLFERVITQSYKSRALPPNTGTQDNKYLLILFFYCELQEFGKHDCTIRIKVVVGEDIVANNLRTQFTQTKNTRGLFNEKWDRRH